jgi:hypothetical protein
LVVPIFAAALTATFLGTLPSAINNPLARAIAAEEEAETPALLLRSERGIVSFVVVRNGSNEDFVGPSVGFEARGVSRRRNEVVTEASAVAPARDMSALRHGAANGVLLPN